MPVDTLRLVVSCPDQPGIIAAVSRFLHERGASIVELDQHTTAPSGGEFYLRTEFTVDAAARGELADRFATEIAAPLGMRWHVSDVGQVKRIAVLVSHADHCLVDLLWRWRRGELGAEITLVASNHPVLRETVEGFGLPFHEVPVAPGAKAEAEGRLADLLAGRCDLIVLARYMQILSGEFLEKVGVPVINIHHSFLPAFAGAGPYERARRRGVKLIGATAHYVTAELDEGPIIEQDVIRTSHRDTTGTLVRLGADVERTVLARAVRWHCDDRLLLHDNRVLVF